MITNNQREFLRKVLAGEITKEDNPKRYSEIMIRIQKTIDEKLTNTVWMAENCPSILDDERAEFDDEELERYRRFKAFAYIISKLNPHYEIERADLTTILKKLSQLYPNFYFEIIRKKHEKRVENVS